MPEDDAPTMTGAPGERRVEHALLPPIEASDGEDTTTAEAGPPAARRDDPGVPDADAAGEVDPHDQEDRTVQQLVEPQPRAPAPVPAAGTPASALLSSTQPSGGLAPAPAAASITQTNETEIEPEDITDDIADDDDDDGEHLEDSITATAPRISHSNLMEAAQSGHGVPIAIPGSVEIRTVEHDDLLDETEVRTRPGHSPLQIPATLRGSPAPMHGSSEPPAPPRPAAGRPPSISPDTENDDDDDDGVTTESLAPAVGSVPDLGMPLPIAPAAATLRASDTAPQSRGPATQASASGSRSASAQRAVSPRPAAGMPFQPDVVDEPPTRPGVEGALDGADELATRPGVEGLEEPATRPGLGESPTRPGAPDPETAKRLDVKRIDVSNSYANEDDEDESVTTRARVGEPYEEKDESVTTQAPAVPPSIIEAAIRAPRGVANAMLDDGTDGTDGTTQRVKKTREADPASPADGEAESITTEAPGPLTNILRVIASGSSPSLGSDPALSPLDEDELPENRTAVMMNAPIKRVIAEHASASALPAIRPTGGPILHGPQGSAAPRLEPSSESGLRVARAGGVDRASLGALGIVGDASAHPNARNSGIGMAANALASDGSISAPMDRAHMSGEQGIFPGQVQPSVHDVDLGKGPRYGLLVAIVAVISIIVPVTLFVWLRHPTEELVPGVPTEPASEIEKHDGARVKAVRGRNGQMIAPPASASTSAGPSSAPSTKAGGRGFPFRR